MARKVLITGMSGLIGGLLKDHLIESGGYELTALNRRSVEGIPTVQADIADLDAIQPAFEGQEVVVHLAAYLGSQDWEGQHAGNVLGTYNVFEASRRAGVKRVIFASSGNAIRGSSVSLRTRTSPPESTTRSPMTSGGLPTSTLDRRRSTAPRKSGAKPWRATSPTTTT